MMSMKHGTNMEAVPMPWTMRPSTHIHRVLQKKIQAHAYVCPSSSDLLERGQLHAVSDDAVCSSGCILFNGRISNE